MTHPVPTEGREGQQHTPGPWKIIPAFGGSRYPSIVNPAGDAELGDWMVAERVRWPADANLIAAAPELLAALTAIVNSTDYGCDEDGKDSDRPLMQNARAAIAKAEGR